MQDLIGGICVAASGQDVASYNSTVTDEHGHYVIEGLQAGQHVVRMQDCREVQPSYALQYYEGAINWNDADPVHVPAGGTIEGIDVTLELAGVIAGTVTAEDTGGPLANICVEAWSDTAYGSWAITDESGDYVLYGLPAGPWTVHFHDCAPSDRSYLFEYYDGTRSWADRAVVQVVSGATATGIDADLAPGGVIEGTITDALTGEPLHAACVSAYGRSGTTSGFGSSDESGRYRVPSLEADVYDLTVFDCNGHDFEEAVIAGVEVARAATTAHDVALQPFVGGDGVIGGFVTDAAGTGLPGAYVYTCMDRQCTSASTGADGAYRLEGLADGSYRVIAHPPQGREELQIASITVQVEDENTVSAPDLVLRALSPPPAATTVGTAPPATIPSVIVNQPFPITTVEPPCEVGTVRYTIIATDGQTISGDFIEDPPGTFTADVTVEFTGLASVVISQDGCIDEVSFNIYIDPSGYVRTPEGEPIAGATVTLLRAESADGPFTVVPDSDGVMSPGNRQNPMMTDDEGHFGWDVTPGFYLVRAEKEGCKSPTDAEQTWVESPVYEIPPPVLDVDLRLDCTPPPPPPVDSTPATKEDCKTDGWEAYGFRNQGLCIQFVNTGRDSR